MIVEKIWSTCFVVLHKKYWVAIIVVVYLFSLGKEVVISIMVEPNKSTRWEYEPMGDRKVEKSSVMKVYYLIDVERRQEKRKAWVRDLYTETPPDKHHLEVSK